MEVGAAILKFRIGATRGFISKGGLLRSLLLRVSEEPVSVFDFSRIGGARFNLKLTGGAISGGFGF